jgi:hypothetical protein
LFQRSQIAKINPKFPHPQSLQHASADPKPPSMPAEQLILLSRMVLKNRQQATRYVTMISEKQLEANRRNAETNEAARPYPRNTDRAGSTSGQGAKTEEGHKRSRMNALRHGLTG